MPMRLFLFAALMSLTLLAAPPAFAKKDGHGNKHDDISMEREDHGKSHKKGHKSHDGHESHKSGGDDDRITISLHFEDHHRNQVRTYLRDHYHGHCPPGLAKKHNGCLPPGQAKKYHVGGMLPHGYEPVPHGLLTMMGPPPAGTFYAMVDKDVVLASEATKKILDAVTLLSAME